MDHSALSSDSVLEILLKTNRPPTDEEKAILDEATVPRNAKLKGLKAQISETVSRIQALNSQVEDATSKLWSLRREESAILTTAANHRRVLSAIRIIPEDVLREICIACVEDTIPSLCYHRISLPYNLAQISRGMRHIALNTPILWARMDVPYFNFRNIMGNQDFSVSSILARKATQWFKRAGQLPLTLSIEDPTGQYAMVEDGKPEPSQVLFDTVLSFSSRIKEIIFNSRYHYLSKLMLKIAALTAADLPLLEVVSLNIVAFNLRDKLPSIGLLTLPTLRRLSLETEHLRGFEINWAVLTSVSLRGGKDNCPCYTRNELARIFQQTKRLAFCDVAVASDRANDANYLGKIALPFLETLYVNEITFGPPTSGARSLLDLITAPALQILRLSTNFLKFSLSNFLEQSPRIWKLTLPYFLEDALLMDTAGLLRYCPSLSVLYLQSFGWDLGPRRPSWDANMLLRAFVEGDVTCPRLQYINFSGGINFSFETLVLFLNGKHGDIATPNVLPWKRVVIDIRSVQPKETRQQISSLLSQKKAEGLDVNAFVENRIRDRDRLFYR